MSHLLTNFSNFINEKHLLKSNIKNYREQFNNFGYVKFDSILSEKVFCYLQTAIAKLQNFAIYKNFEMKEYNSPRKMSVLGGDNIIQYNPELLVLYFHHQLRYFLEKISGAKIFDCLHPQEFMVINYLHGPRQTHGWHLDDPELAFVICIECLISPDKEGVLEFIPNFNKLLSLHPHEKNFNNIAKLARKEGELFKASFYKQNQAYLLAAGSHLHRVTPLKNKDSRRTVINIAFNTKIKDVKEYGNTASKLYT
jgi:hypothetical protein